MLTILLHSSKTMRSHIESNGPRQIPQLLDKATELAMYLQTLSVGQIAEAMQLSPKKATQTYDTLASWRRNAAGTPAIDAFIGDIYSGLQVSSFTRRDRAYANEHLYILSGLYGVLRALDSVLGYRLEMGYRIPGPYKNLYDYWADSIAHTLPDTGDIVNLSAAEYTKAVFPHLRGQRIIAPKFLTVSPKTGEPTFVTVHAKIARGACAHWLITHRVESIDQLKKFDELNYEYNASLSTDTEPVFVCQTFGGLGMSVRLT